MIPCPNCGTRNRRGSKYCYCCGQPLGIVFNVSCPVCDRLNPAGSSFCAFCGAKIGARPPGEQAGSSEQPASLVRGTLQGTPRAEASPGRPQRELPPWLYEQPTEHPAGQTLPSPVSSSAAVEPPLAQSKYLSDIPGALPKTEGWLSSVPKVEGKPIASRVPESKRRMQGGCLMLPLLALLGAIALVLSRR
jgi:hypothetical protein